MIIPVFLLVLVLFTFTACSGDSAAESVSSENVTAYNANGIELCESDTPVPLNALQSADNPQDGFIFEFRSTSIHLGQNMAEILNAIGEPLGVHETPSCAFDGFDRIFMFPGVQFHTFPDGDDDFLQIISIWDDSVTTCEGVFLGSGWEDVLAAYGTDYSQDFSIFTFERGGTTLSFFVESDVVVEISYSLIM